ncbi:hypothetical protein PG997_014326 [Apiospora hydei]|uniref:Uncharacterized protein n=1 Tax=Apiospora hydei TaxID=1337664 RepID=A0ABR1UTG8_9PEZI
MCEDACTWLLEKNLGFSSRPDGIPIDCLSEAAAYIKIRVLRALIAYFKARLAPENFQQTLTLALHGATGGYYLPLSNDGHEEIIDILNRAGMSFARTDMAGLLARAVRFSPRDAIYLLRFQMEQNITDYRDLKAALSEALLWGDELRNDDALRLEFFKVVFPNHTHLAYSPAELKFFTTVFPENVGLEYRPAELETARERFRAFENLVDSFIDQMRKRCFENQSYDVAMYIVQVVGRARIGEDLVKDLERARSEYYSSVLTGRRIEFYQS